MAFYLQKAVAIRSTLTGRSEFCAGGLRGWNSCEKSAAPRPVRGYVCKAERRYGRQWSLKHRAVDDAQHREQTESAKRTKISQHEVQRLGKSANLRGREWTASGEAGDIQRSLCHPREGRPVMWGWGLCSHLLWQPQRVTHLCCGLHEPLAIGELWMFSRSGGQELLRVPYYVALTSWSWISAWLYLLHVAPCSAQGICIWNSV